MKIFKAVIIAFISCYPIDKVLASYVPVNGRISYLAGALMNTNFQEHFFNNNNSQSKLGRSQSFALLLQALGDLDSSSSLMAEITLGTHKFYKETPLFLDEYNLEAISFDLGYRHHVIGDFWVSGSLGSLYPWKVTQHITSKTEKNNESDFDALYSVIFGIQYETNLFARPVSYAFRIQKYMSSHIDDQMAIGLSVGWRFN